MSKGSKRRPEARKGAFDEGWAILNRGRGKGQRTRPRNATRRAVRGLARMNEQAMGEVI
jgi:hypothetical protein